MAGLLVTLGKRILGFNSSNGCCATPTAVEDKTPATKVIEVITPATGPEGGSCCAPSCCASTAPADKR